MVSVPVVTIQEENFYDMWPESKPLREANHAESPISIPGLELNINVEEYKRAASAGKMVVLTVRDGAKLVGYHFTKLTPHSHFSILAGFSDSYYLSPEYRGAGIGTKLFKMTEKIWKEKSAQFGFIACRTQEAINYTPLFKKLGWVENEVSFVKRLED